MCWLSFSFVESHLWPGYIWFCLQLCAYLLWLRSASIHWISLCFAPLMSLFTNTEAQVSPSIAAWSIWFHKCMPESPCDSCLLLFCCSRIIQRLDHGLFVSIRICWLPKEISGDLLSKLPFGTVLQRTSVAKALFYGCRHFVPARTETWYHRLIAHHFNHLQQNTIVFCINLNKR